MQQLIVFTTVVKSAATNCYVPLLAPTILILNFKIRSTQTLAQLINSKNICAIYRYILYEGIHIDMNSLGHLHVNINSN